MAFSATETGTAGFRLVAAKPRVVAIWSGAMIAAGLASSLISAVLIGGEMVKMTGGKAAVASVNWLSFMVGYGVVLAFAVVSGALFYTAIYRAVLKPEDRGFAYLKLGADELRMMGLYAVIVGIFVLAMIAVWFVAFIVAVVIAIAGAASGGRGATALVTLAVVAVVIPLMFSVICWLSVRLSMAGPMTLDTGRISIGPAWKLTKGRFWSLFGAFALSWLLGMVLWVVAMSLAAVAAAAFGGTSGLAQALGIGKAAGELYTLQAVLAPARLASMIAFSTFSGLIYSVWLAPGAAAYQALGPANQTADTFA